MRSKDPKWKFEKWAERVEEIKRGILAGEPVPAGYTATIQGNVVTLRRIMPKKRRPDARRW